MPVNAWRLGLAMAAAPVQASCSEQLAYTVTTYDPWASLTKCTLCIYYLKSMILANYCCIPYMVIYN